jgi:hypothetical protein
MTIFSPARFLSCSHARVFFIGTSSEQAIGGVAEGGLTRQGQPHGACSQPV